VSLDFRRWFVLKSSQSNDHSFSLVTFFENRVQIFFIWTADEAFHSDSRYDFINCCVRRSTNKNSFDFAAQEHGYDSGDSVSLSSSWWTLDQKDVALWHINDFIQHNQLAGIKQLFVPFYILSHFCRHVIFLEVVFCKFQWLNLLSNLRCSNRSIQLFSVSKEHLLFHLKCLRRIQDDRSHPEELRHPQSFVFSNRRVQVFKMVNKHFCEGGCAFHAVDEIAFGNIYL
jgi:hypothetical protein